jgi:phosphoribosylformylglycinamidine (FGAM) synthase-like enzyme
VVGILDDVSKAAQMNFTAAGRVIMLLRGGEAADITDVQSEFGSSEYAKEILGALWGYPPDLDLEKEAALQKAVVQLIEEGLAESVHDCAEGGLAVTLAEKAFAKGVGARVNLASSGLPAEFVLYGEDASRIVVSCDPESVSRIQTLAEAYGIAADVLGETITERLEILLDGQMVVSAAVSDLNRDYEGALEAMLRSDSELVAAD